MKVINPPDKVIMQLIGKKTCDSKTRYRLLRWISRIEIDEIPGEKTHLHRSKDINETNLKDKNKDKKNGTILHNYITGETIFFDASEYREISEILKNPETLKKTGSSADCAGSHTEHLIKGLFLVPEDHDDIEIVHQLRSALKLINTKKEITSFKILTTTDCNARCFYCYEAGIGKSYMSSGIADKVTDYIIKRSGGKKVTLAWFGGEPLLGTDIIDHICSRLTEDGMEYISVMTSNGYLFDPEMIERAVKNWHLNNIQITLDGTENVYNRIKSYVDINRKHEVLPEVKDENSEPGPDGFRREQDIKKTSPFMRVTENIRALASKGVRVNVRLNLTKDNFRDLLELVDFLSDLADTLPDRKKLNVYASPLFEDMKNDDAFKEKLIKNTDELTEKIRKKDLESRSYKALKLRISGCMADNDAHRGISPLGDIIKCEHHIYDKTIGKLENLPQEKSLCDMPADGSCMASESQDNCCCYKEDPFMIKEWKTPMESGDICMDCPLFPTCYRLKNCPVSHICSPSEKQQQIRKNENLIIKKVSEE